MKYKITGMTLAVVALISGILMIYQVNQTYPNPQHEVIRPGEIAKYKGLVLYAGNIEVYETGEVKTVYTDVDEELFEEDAYWVIINVELENQTEEEIKLTKERLTDWRLEAGVHMNGISAGAFMQLNPDFHSDWKAGEKQSVKLPFSIWKKSLEQTGQVMKETDIMLVYSYYPTKNYILYEAKE